MELNPFYETIIDDLITKKFAVVDHFFTNDEVQALKENLVHKYEDDAFKKAAIGNVFQEQIVKSIRGDYIYWLNEQEDALVERVFFDKINDLVQYLNRTCFLGIREKEFHYAVYPEGTFYKRHLDTFQNDDRRKLSIVCYLNDEHWEPDFGGALAIYHPSEQGEATTLVYPLQGRMVIFESQVLEHEVLPVYKSRFSITGWLKTS
ncbi:MAG: 2OG-Fe(II) oxygenase [Flavobacterium sp.]